jgi:outer membrane receptor protein involved in Fe transport
VDEKMAVSLGHARLALLCFCFLIPLPLIAQMGQITGLVTDISRAPIPQAHIKIENLETRNPLQVVTNKEGLFLLPSLLPGRYDIEVSAPGFETKTVQAVRVEVAGKVSLDFMLRVGAATEDITVNAADTNLNTTDATVSTVIDPVFVGDMPLNGRSFQSLLTLAPGTAVVPSSGVGYSGEISVNGQRTEANYFTVDGVSVNTGISATGVVGQGAGYGGSTAGETVIGGTQSMVSVDALQEFRATTSTYSAAYGRVPGGQFSFQTRSGTTHLHGSAFEYLRNEMFDANDWFSNALGTARQKTRQNDFGAVLGGPIRFPRKAAAQTFFFGSYEGMLLSSPVAAQQYQVPSNTLRTTSNGTVLRALLSAFPAPNGDTLSNGLAYYTAAYSIPSRLDVGGLRLDREFGNRMHGFARFQETRSNSTRRLSANVAETLPSTVNVRSITTGVTRMLTQRLANDLRFNLTWNDSAIDYVSTDFGGATPFDKSSVSQLLSTPYNRFYVGLNFGGKPNFSFLPQSTSQRQLNIVDSMTVTWKRHALTWGADYRRLNDLVHVPTIYAPTVYSSASTVLANKPGSNVVAKLSIPVIYPIFNNLSAYMQDEWRTTERLSLSLGVRWEWNPAPYDGAGSDAYTMDQIIDLSTTKLAPRGTPLWNTPYLSFAPRFGAAYRANTSPRFGTVIRTGFGVFYDITVANALGGYARQGYRTSVQFQGKSFPLTQEQVDSVAAPSITPPYTESIFSADPNLKLPYTYQYNLTVEQQFGAAQSLVINYVGSASRRMLATRSYTPSLYGNSRFSSTSTALVLTQNVAAANYNALQVQFQRRMAHGFQALADYTWSHAMDDTTTNFTVYELTRAASDYDIRSNFQAALTYTVPKHFRNAAADGLLGGWSADGRISARSSMPVDIIGQSAVVDTVAGQTVNFHPNRVSGEPLYIQSNYYGTPVRRINPSAFVAATSGTEGNVGRNSAQGFAAYQTDLALRKQFTLRDNINLQVRGEAFNFLNQGNFGSIYNLISNTSFGLPYTSLNSQLGGLNSLHQQGGPRSIQLALRFQF